MNDIFKYIDDIMHRYKFRQMNPLIIMKLKNILFFWIF